MKFPVVRDREPAPVPMTLEEYASFVWFFLRDADPVKLQKQKEAEEVIERAFSLSPQRS